MSCEPVFRSVADSEVLRESRTTPRVTLPIANVGKTAGITQDPQVLDGLRPPGAVPEDYSVRTEEAFVDGRRGPRPRTIERHDGRIAANEQRPPRLLVAETRTF
jgi:hypothetical protein